MQIQSQYFFDVIPIQINIDDERANNILKNFPAPPLPNGEKTFDINHQRAGANISEHLLLNDYEVKLTRTNKQFLKLSFSNNNGIISAKMWDNQGAIEKNLPLLEKYAVFEVEGIIDAYNGQKSITVNQLTAIDGDMNPFNLLPHTSASYSDLTIELLHYLYQLNQPYQQLAVETLKTFWHDFSIVPAAKSHHHNYLGGLLKHTVGLMRFANYIISFDKGHVEGLFALIQIVEKAYKKELYLNYKGEKDPYKRATWNDTIDHLYRMTKGAMNYETKPNYDILILSILFHDIGKMLEYDHAGKSYHGFELLYPTADKTTLQNRKQAGITMDPLGVLIGHIPYGVLLFNKLIEQFNITLTIDAIHEISHCILCHHGLPEWGSAVRAPLTLDGYLIHIVDYLDSRYENAVEHE
ncbi:hydrolase [Amphibacillus cookii]|uniref:hydrolase n=1 Tax=Amphibacillus cookii TaxID=767787 RepID=UPI00195B05F5|nr:hydrolase [Amphibacillus cookii]MBM7541512.1 3'-5' exoribonuclease [Amphibacillus cookii]